MLSVTPDTPQRKSTRGKNRVPAEIEFAKFVELLPEMIARTDRDLNITYVNKQGLEATGYTNKDIKDGLNLMELISRNDRAKAKKQK